MLQIPGASGATVRNTPFFNEFTSRLAALGLKDESMPKLLALTKSLGAVFGVWDHRVSGTGPTAAAMVCVTGNGPAALRKFTICGRVLKRRVPRGGPLTPNVLFAGSAACYGP